MNTLRKLQKSIENVETELDKCFIVDGTEGLSSLIQNSLINIITILDLIPRYQYFNSKIRTDRSYSFGDRCFTIHNLFYFISNIKHNYQKESGMKAEFNKITEKMDQRDPITNEARYFVYNYNFT